MEEEERIHNVNAPQMQESSFLQYRLDPSHLINQIRTTLSGKVVSYIQDDNGMIVKEEEQSSPPMVNNKGFATIVNWVSSIVNTQTGQGNLTDDQYMNYIADARENLSMILFINMYEWDIDEKNYEYIIESIMNVVKLFVTRLIDNKERESYHMFKQIETNRTQPVNKFRI